jgi:HlyD family secretion protein
MRTKLLPTTIMLTSVLALAACGDDDHDGRIHASGHIEATEVHLAAKVGGRLLEAPFEEGDTVREGAVVARLDTVDAEHRLAQARAQAGAADAQLRLLLAGTRAEDLRRAEDRLAQAQAELDAADRDLARLAGLAERGTATEKARDDAETRQEIAERGVAAARAELDKLISGPRSQEIEAARAQRAAAEAQVAAVQQNITDATVTAPRDGVLIERVAEPGEVLASGMPIAVLVDLARPWLDVWVGEPSLASIRLGEPVEVRVDGHEGALEGTVAYISDIAEFTPKNVQTPEERSKLVFRVKIGLDNRDGLFKPGMPADAWFGAAPEGPEE